MVDKGGKCRTVKKYPYSFDVQTTLNAEKSIIGKSCLINLYYIKS